MRSSERVRPSGLGGARRILLYGVTGSGKTTLARRLASLTGLPWTEADTLTWLPGWTSRPEEEQRRLVHQVCSEDRWILDTAYGVWAEVPLARAELVVALDYPRWRSLARLARRTLARTWDGQEVCNGNVETWHNTLSSDSILAWHFRSFSRKHETILAWQADPALPPVVRIRTPAELEAWMAEVRLDAAGGEG